MGVATKTESLTINKLDGESRPAITAMFNPKELSVDKGVPWNKHAASETDKPILEFTAAEPKTASFELMLDTFEAKSNVKDEVDKLYDLVLIDSTLKRPPMVAVNWGQFGEIFKGVIDKMGVKYTLFLGDGTPVRATVTLSLKEADKALNKAEGKKLTDDNAKKKAGKANQAGPAGRADNQAAANGSFTPAGTPDHRSQMESNGADSHAQASQPGRVTT